MSYRTDNIWKTLRGMAQGGGTFASSPFKSIFLDPVNGNDANDGLSLSNAKKTLAGAYAIATSGNNDTIYLVANGASTGTARVDSAFTWAKNATHLVGITPPNRVSLRARIAPTATTTAFANFFTLTGKGCFFQNIQWWHGFNTGVAASICMTLSGGANCNRFENCHIAGMGDDASAQDTGSRALLMYGAEENEFVNCTIGVDTVARTALNALIEFKPATGSGNPRNKFINCDFPAWTTTAQTQLDVLVSAAGGLDRWELFDRCRFMNSLFATGYLIQTAIASAPANAGGLLLFKDCTSFGRTGFGKDATTRGFIKIDGAAPTNTTSGLAIAPNA